MQYGYDLKQLYLLFERVLNPFVQTHLIALPCLNKNQLLYMGFFFEWSYVLRRTEK